MSFDNCKAEAERLLAAGLSRSRVAEKQGIHVSALYLNMRKGRSSVPKRRTILRMVYELPEREDALADERPTETVL